MTDLGELVNLRRLLDRQGVSVSTLAAANLKGFSGARIFEQSGAGGRRHVVKITSLRSDWIRRTTADVGCREAAMARESFFRRGRIHSPAIDAVQDEDVHAILMEDVSEHLLPNAPLTNAQLEQLLQGMAELHSRPIPPTCEVPWCPIEARLRLFMPDPGQLASFRIGADILRGWDLFFRYAPAEVAALVRALFADPQPIVQALSQLPSCLLHGDLKLDNIALRPEGSLSLIDWSMPMEAPAAVDLGWFLAMNSRWLPICLDDAIAAYVSHAGIEARLQERHRSLTILCGLLIRGWRKALDAEAGDPAELSWWCNRAASAMKIL